MSILKLLQNFLLTYTKLYKYGQNHCYLHKPVFRVFHNATFTNEVKSWFDLVYRSNLLCSFMKLLQIALQPKPNCCWNAFSKMENTEIKHSNCLSTYIIYCVSKLYTIIIFLFFNIVSHWGIDDTRDFFNLFSLDI